jgi:hypothetical protein
MTAAAIHPHPLEAAICGFIQHLAAKAQGGAYTIRVHPLHIADSLLDDLKTNGLVEPVWENVARQFCHLAAGLILRLAYDTMAHHLVITLTAGANLPYPPVVNPLALYAGFDSKSAVFHHYMGEDELPRGVVTDGIVLVCEPVETGFYRVVQIRDNVSEFSQSDGAMFQWTIRALMLFEELKQAKELPLALEGERVKLGELVLKFMRDYLMYADTAKRKADLAVEHRAADEMMHEHRQMPAHPPTPHHPHAEPQPQES